MSTASPARPSASAGTLGRGLRVMARGVSEQKGWFAVSVLGSAVYGVMTVATATVIGKVTDETVAPAIAARSVTAGQLAHAALLLVLVVVINVVGIVVRRIAAGVAVFNLGAIFRRRVTRQYLRLPLSWHHRHPSGQLLSNANADVESTFNVFNPLPMAIGVVIMLAFAAVQMVLVDLWLALIGFLVFPSLFLANLAFQRAMSPKATRAQQLRAGVSEVAHESFEAALIVKSLGREDQEAARFSEVTQQLRDANIEVGRTRGVFDPAIEAIPQLGTLAVLLVGVGRVRSGDLSAAEVVQIAYLFSILAFPVRALGWVLAEMPRSVVGWDRVDAVLRATGSMEHGTSALPAHGASTLRAVDVSYAYEVAADVDLADEAAAERGVATPAAAGSPPERHVAVDGVSLDVRAGGTTALVGPTGSGKSTLTSLMMRLVDPDTGTVLVDDVDLRDVRPGGIAERAALVSQATFMFDDTVRGNITLGAEHTDDEVWAALRVAQGHGFVGVLEHGLDTRVGERGASLSGGQRQRIALARAVIRRPQLLVLDDATSAVDPSVEQAILAALRAGSSGTTVLVVAYRMATITLADDVVYLEGGRVVDHGPHDELRRRCPGYERLVTAYAREAAEREAVAAEEQHAEAERVAQELSERGLAEAEEEQQSLTLEDDVRVGAES